MAALEQVMAHHEPNPAVVLGRNWNVPEPVAQRCNGACLRVSGRRSGGDVGTAMPGQRTQPASAYVSSRWRTRIHRQLARDRPKTLAHTQREAEIDGNTTLLALLDNILDYPCVPRRWHVPNWETPPPPVLPFEYHVGGTRLKLFSMLSTFARRRMSRPTNCASKFVFRPIRPVRHYCVKLRTNSTYWTSRCKGGCWQPKSLISWSPV